MKAIGECGLDFSKGPDPAERAVQVEVFRAQLELARETGLALTIHCVKAHATMLELLRARPTPPSVMHAFSGSAELARQFVGAGHYVSFAGNLLIANARKAVEAARVVPEDRLLIETDDGGLELLGDVAERLASLRETSVEAIAARTFANACRVFGIAEPGVL